MLHLKSYRWLEAVWNPDKWTLEQCRWSVWSGGKHLWFILRICFPPIWRGGGLVHPVQANSHLPDGKGIFRHFRVIFISEPGKKLGSVQCVRPFCTKTSTPFASVSTACCSLHYTIFKPTKKHCTLGVRNFWSVVFVCSSIPMGARGCHGMSKQELITVWETLTICCVPQIVFAQWKASGLSWRNGLLCWLVTVWFAEVTTSCLECSEGANTPRYFLSFPGLGRRHVCHLKIEEEEVFHQCPSAISIMRSFGLLFSWNQWLIVWRTQKTGESSYTACCNGTESFFYPARSRRLKQCRLSEFRLPRTMCCSETSFRRRQKISLWCLVLHSKD